MTKWTALSLLVVPLIAARAQTRAQSVGLTSLGHRTDLTAGVVAIATVSPTVTSNPIALKSLVPDTVGPDHRVTHGAIIGGVIGAVAGAALGATLPMGCISPIEGGDPHCSTTRKHVEAAVGTGLVAGIAGAVIGAAVAKLSSWL